MIVQIDSALDSDECLGLIDAFEDHADAAVEPSTERGRNVYMESLGPAARSVVEHAVARCYEQLLECVALVRPIQVETVILNCLGVGGHHTWHADNCERDGFGGWVPNHTPDRQVSLACYLNADFEGGEVAFEDHPFHLKPWAGLMLAFPSDHLHVHGVAEVTRGRRYALLTWWTFAVA